MKRKAPRKDDAFRRSLAKLNRDVARTPTLDLLARRVLEIVDTVAPVDAMFLAFLREDGHYLKILETDLDDHGHRVFLPERPMETVSRILETLREHPYILINRTPAEVRNLEIGTAPEDPWTPMGNPKRRSASLLFLPIWFDFEYAGALSIQSYSFKVYTPGIAERLRSVTESVGIAARNAGLRKDLVRKLGRGRRG